MRIELLAALLGFSGALAGCGGSQAPKGTEAPPLKGASVSIAAVGDGAILPVVTAQLGEWQASREAVCVVESKPVEVSNLGGAQVLLFRGDRLGDLVDAGALAVLPESLVQPASTADSGEDGKSVEVESSRAPDQDDPEPLQFSDVIPAYRDQVSKYGSDRMALPLGGTALVLVYNRAAFDGPGNLDAAKAAGLTLEPPATWKELDALARFFEGRNWNGAAGKDHGIALPLGEDSEGVADACLIARAAALGLHKDHYSLLFDSDTMEPRLTSPPFVEALQGLAGLKTSGPPGMESFDARAAREAFRKGNVAFLIDRAEQAGQWGGAMVKRVGVAPLPGSERVFEPVRAVWEPVKTPNRPSYLPAGGGWLVGVSATAAGREREAAIDFVKYLINAETSNRLRADRDLPMLPVRSSQLGQGLIDPRSTPGVESRDWSEAVNKTLVALRVLPGLRIPQADAYLADLAKGRVEAVQGKPADAALKEAAQAWSGRTKALGTARQLWHYRRSLNSLVTLSKPPSR